MKKTISFILAISLIMSVFVVGSVSTSAAETETLIYSFDSVATGVTPAFNIGLDVELNAKTEGTGSTWMNFKIPTGQSANVGGMFFVDFSAAKDLSAYDKLRFDLYTPVALQGDGGRLQINFVTDSSSQDGYNWDADISFTNVGWNTITIQKSAIPVAVSTNWASIKRLRVTWFNDNQISNISFVLLDNLRGVNGEPDASSSGSSSSNPSTNADGSTVLHAFDEGSGFTPVGNGSFAGMNTTDKTQGIAAFQWKFPQPTTSGTLLYYDYTSSQDFSAYNTFKIDVYTPVAIGGGVIEFDICSSNSAQNGFNFEILASNLNVGWNTIELKKVNTGDEAATWSDVRRLRWLWHNDVAASVEYFIFDNLRGYTGSGSGSGSDSSSDSSTTTDPTKGHTPYAVGDDLMINNADAINGWTSAFNANVAATKQFLEGKGAVNIVSTIPVGQASQVGSMAFLDFPVTDLSAYNAFSFKVRINNKLTNSADSTHELQVNFVDGDGQDGYNFNYTGIAGKSEDWYHIVVKKSDIPQAVSTAKWSSINRLRITWFNKPQENVAASFTIDEIMAHVKVPEGSSDALPDPNKASVPVVLEDGSLFINGGEEWDPVKEIYKGWSPAFSTKVTYSTRHTTGMFSAAMVPDCPVGQNGNVGAMAFLDFGKAFSLDDYETISLDFYIDKETEGTQVFEINFCSPGGDGQVGFTKKIYFTGYGVERWYTIVFKKSDLRQEDPAASWSNINRMRFTWFNESQEDAPGQTFYIDNIKAYPAGFENLPDSSLDTCPYTYGDVDANKELQTSDALAVLHHITKKSTLSRYQQYVADVAKPEGVINSSDALVILQRCVSKIEKFDTSSKESYVSQYESYEPDPVTVPDSIVKNNAYGKDGEDGSDKTFSLDMFGIKPKTIYYLKAGEVSKGRSADILRIVYSFQGLFNREFGMDEKHSSIIFVDKDEADNFWKKYINNADEDGNLLDINPDSIFAKNNGFNVETITSWTHFYKTFANQLKQCGYVLWDGDVPATANVAGTICGVDGYLPVRAGSDAEAYLKGKGVQQKQSLVGMFTGSGTIPGTSMASTGSPKNDAYRWALEKYFSKCSYDYVGYTVDGWATLPNAAANFDTAATVGHCMENHDYLIARRAFFFDLSPYNGEIAKDAGGGKLGLDVETMEMIFARRYERSGGKMGVVMGFVPWWIKYTTTTVGPLAGTKKSAPELEWLLSEMIGCYNLTKEADAFKPPSMTNGSVFYKYTVKDAFKNKNHPKYNNGATKVSSYNSNTHYFTIYVGDYDSSAWVKKHVAGFWMSDANRGNIDLMWSMNPNLAYRIPMCFEYMYDTLTDSDYMAAGEGAGYVIPTGLFAGKTTAKYGKARPYADASQLYANYAKPFYDMCDMDITGFLILGNNMFTDAKIADMYRQFSPAAVFHQAPSNSTYTNWNLAKRGDTPFIVCRQTEIYNDTPVTDLYNFSFNTMGGAGSVSVFRTVCQSPTVIKGIVDNYTSYAASRGKTVKYVDPYSFIKMAKASNKLTAK